MRLPWRTPFYIPFRIFGWPRLLPLNVTVSVTNRCNSRCRTCNIWKKQPENEFTTQEFDRVFQSLGHAPYWFTFSGGEPFLRKDLEDICESAYTQCRPAILNIPSNGLLYRQIPDRVADIARRCPDSDLIVNLSLDGVGEAHDEMRGVPGNFERVMGAFEGLKALDIPNLTVGLHTVISVYNLDQFQDIYDFAHSLGPDSYVTEIAEERVELGTVDSGITPQADDYAQMIDFLSDELRRAEFSGISRITQAMRLVYYDLVKRILRERRQVIPCYGGWLSAHILPDGKVWECCIMGSSMGNLRDFEYDMRRLWAGEQAKAVRHAVKTRGCYCPLANIAYTNMMAHPLSVLKIGVNLLQSGRR